MDTLTSMRAFARVAEAKNFTEAAKRLKLSPAMVTKHIQNLEQRLGTRLVNRSTRQLSLTEAGAAYYRRCVQLLADVDEAESAAGSLGAQPRGRLRVTAPIHFGPAELRPIVQGFIQAYPEISVEVLTTNQRTDLIEDGIDLAVRIAARALEPSLIARRLATSRLVACASPAYLKRHGVPAQPADLKNHQCLTTTLFKLDQGWPFRRAGKSETVKLAAALQSNNNELLCEAAADGFGITVQPTLNVWRGLATGRLTTILDKWSLGELGIFVVYPSRRFLPAKTRLFIDYLTARFPGGAQHDVWMERARSS